MAPSRRRNMVHVIPTTVWLKILSYLSDEDIKKVEAIDKLQSIIWCWRYSSVTLDLEEAKKDKGFIKKWEFFSAPAFPGVKRHLAFSRAPVSSLEMRPYNPTFKVIRQTLQWYYKVTSMDFFWNEEIHHDVSFYVAPLLVYAVTCHTRSLETMRIGALPLDSISYFLSSFRRWLPNLTRLEMVLPSFLNIDVKEAAEGHLYRDITTFIDLHWATLQTLMIQPKQTRCSCPGHTSSTFDVDLERILGNVASLGQLRNLYIQPGHSRDQKALRGFLERSSDNLKRLTVYIPEFAPNQAAANLYTPSLHLEHLTFDDQTHDPSSLEFVAQYSLSLVSLVIQTRRLDASDWAMLCGSKWPKLKSLEFTLLNATVETFDAIATHFESLLCLKLTVASETMETETVHAEFANEMEKRGYTSPLRSLTIDMPFFPKYCVDAVVRAFPALVTVGDLTKETYLRLDAKEEVESK